jgi:hypothetical protein
MFTIAVVLTIGLAMGPAYAGDATADADVTSDILIDQSGDSISTRQIPGGVYQPPQVNPQYHNAPHTRTWNIFQFAELAKIRRTWTRIQLEVILDWADGDDGDVSAIPYNAVPAITAKKDRSPYDAISMIFSTTVPAGHIDKGIIQAKGEADTNGIKMAAQSLLDAINMGGKYLMIVVDDAEIQQYTKAKTFFIGGGMSAIGSDSASGAHGGGGASGIGAGKITSGKGLAPHATGVVLDELGTPMMLQKGKVVPRDADGDAHASLLGKLNAKAASLDEAGRGPQPVKGKATSGDNMSNYYNETK